MTKDIFVLVQFNKTTGIFEILYFNDAVDTKEFTAGLIPADPGNDIVISSFFVNPDKKKVTKPDIKLYTKPQPPVSLHRGLLYNPKTILNPLFAPPGYHVPTKAELLTLVNNYGTADNAGKNLNENQFQLNSNSFFRDNDGTFYDFIRKCVLATSTINGPDNLWTFEYYFDSVSFSSYFASLNNGMSVRLLKNDEVWQAGDSVSDIEGNVYPTFKFGNQVFTTMNFKCKKLNDGTVLSNVPLDADWAQDQGLSYCAYNNDFFNV
jgi:hypothetical protein